MPDSLPGEGSGNGAPAGFGERFAQLASGARDLLGTRAAMFRRELAAKSADLAVGAAAVLLAAAFGWLALLLLTAFLAALLARLLGGPLAGIAVTFGLYAAVAAVAAWIGVRKLGRVRPFEYPVTRAEIDRDVAALRAAARAPEPEENPEEEVEDVLENEDARADVESRFREGSE